MKKKWKFLRREVAIMSLATHPNVLHCIAADISPKDALAIIILPLVEKGSLHDLLSKGETKSWSLKRSLSICAGVAKGMDYLALCGIIHRDLKPANILIDADYTARVADYGRSRAISLDDLQMTRGVGSPIFMAPELMRNNTRTYRTEVDVYSFGLLLWQMITQQRPYRDFTGGVADFVRLMADAALPRPLIDNNIIPPELGTIIEQCWAENPQSRPTFGQVAKILEDFIVDLG